MNGRFDSPQAKTGRLVQHYGSIASARLAAPRLLGVLAKSTSKSNLLPSIPDDCETHDAVGHWAAKLISQKPEGRRQTDPGLKIARADAHRPTLGMRKVCQARLGSLVLPPSVFKEPRTNPIKAALSRSCEY